MADTDELITLVTPALIGITFDPSDFPSWDIFDANSGLKIGRLEVDCKGMFIGADIEPTYQRKGIATTVVRYLVEKYDIKFFFWRPDGLRYDDTRHLSVEGAKLANSLIRNGLASWIENAAWDEED